mmetsp:Transcript_6988/g.12891  ORF Transcript_6988/g.12891 Transcript_6988/m.12891 type:complete len:228 (+) Transcript_6988:1199-1882(+)
MAVCGVIPPMVSALMPSWSRKGVAVMPETPETPETIDCGVAEGVAPDLAGVPWEGVASGFGVLSRARFGAAPPKFVSTSTFSPPSSGVWVFRSLMMFWASSITVSLARGVRMGVLFATLGVCSYFGSSVEVAPPELPTAPAPPIFDICSRSASLSWGEGRIISARVSTTGTSFILLIRRRCSSKFVLRWSFCRRASFFLSLSSITSRRSPLISSAVLPRKLVDSLIL